MKRHLFITVLLLAGMALADTAAAGELADNKLLEILEQKGFLTSAEVKSVKQILDQEKAPAPPAAGGNAVNITFEDGLLLETRDGTTFSARLGGRIQTDLRMFDGHYPVDNDFDIRRARFYMAGRIYEYFHYKLSTEFEGSSSNRLVDAYVDFDYFPGLRIRLGQFKEPFSFETLSSSKYLPFTERSMIHYLAPSRDVGIMLHGRLFKSTLRYAVGIFNGEGRDASRRDQKDDKELAARIMLQPCAAVGPAFLRGLHLGASYAYARLDTSDFSFKIKTPGLTTFFTLQARAKFHITQEVDTLERYGLELVYTVGPLLFMAEHIRCEFSNVRLADTSLFDFDMQGWYAGVLLMLTGEQPQVKKGVLQRIRPRNNFNIRTGGLGAWGLGFRVQEFRAERIVYDALVHEGYSARKASAFTIALNWYLNSMVRVSFNYSRTRFDEPLFLGTHWKGYSYYEKTEHTWVARFQLEF
ncbi:MAG: hypothetical protein GY868_15290 [Deltaproteobacteria bacterium]|nr:hypothetical protein [Deltaproteobacteria bacterium]